MPFPFSILQDFDFILFCFTIQLSEDALTYVNDLVNAPESLLSGRPTMRIYLNDMIFQVVKGKLVTGI